MEVSASILSADFKKLDEEIKKVEKHLNYLHLDVMDGLFVPNISFGIPIIKSLKNNFNLIFDTHLMIIDPIRYIKDFYNAGSNIITFHYETTDNVLECIDEIKKYNIKVGISLKPDTNVEVLDKYLPLIDLVLIMSVEPGFGGQKFMDSSIYKIEYLNKKRKENNYNYLIEVDGGINNITKKLVKNVGCDIVVAGSYIFNSDNYEERINSLK